MLSTDDIAHALTVSMMVAKLCPDMSPEAILRDVIDNLKADASPVGRTMLRDALLKAQARQRRLANTPGLVCQGSDTLACDAIHDIALTL